MPDQLSDTHDQITRAVEALVTGTDWQQMLTVAARFTKYSPTNVMLIAAQRPDATRVAGYQLWRTLGRQVGAGERGIRILAPIVRRHSAADEPDPTQEEPSTARAVRGFRVVYVFDVSQTAGPDLPDVAPHLLDGDAPVHLWTGIAGLITAVGFTLTRGWCQGANGYTDHSAREVRVRDDLSPAAALKTLTHELAHVRLHARTDDARSELDRCRMEVEAESVAWLVLSEFGIDAGQYSFPYIARWSRGDIDRIRTSATTAIACARQILTDLTPAATMWVAASTR